MHSGKRNRLGQRNVERLVRAHTNLILDNSLNDFAAATLPWELEMIIEEPEDADLVSDGQVPWPLFVTNKRPRRSNQRAR